MTRIGDVTRRGDGDARGPAEPGTAGPGVWGGTGTPWGQPQAGGGPQPSPSYMGRGSQAGSGAQSHLPHIHPPQPLALILPPGWESAPPQPGGCGGLPPGARTPQGFAGRSSPTPPRPLQAVFGGTAALGATRTPHKGWPLWCATPERGRARGGGTRRGPWGLSEALCERPARLSRSCSQN